MGRRPKRVGEQILRELGALFSRGKIKDPDIGFVTFTAVDMSPDLRLARVYFSVMGEAAEVETSRAALERAAPFVRRELGRQLRLKVTPSLEFLHDASLDHAARIEQLLREVWPAEAEAATLDDEDGDGGD